MVTLELTDSEKTLINESLNESYQNCKEEGLSKALKEIDKTREKLSKGVMQFTGLEKAYIVGGLNSHFKGRLDFYFHLPDWKKLYYAKHPNTELLYLNDLSLVMNKFLKKKEHVLSVDKMLGAFRLLVNADIKEVHYSFLNKEIYKIAIPIDSTNYYQLLSLDSDSNFNLENDLNLAQTKLDTLTYMKSSSPAQAVELLESYEKEKALSSRQKFVHCLLTKSFDQRPLKN